jgi:hypothetical protein
MRLIAFACFTLAAAISAPASGAGSGPNGKAVSGNPPGVCPPAWHQATPPVNPALGCLPNNVYIPTRPDGTRDIPPGLCPEGWLPATPPLNPLLVCLPTTIAQPETISRSPDIGTVRAESLFCPHAWAAVSRLKHGALICLPRAVLARLPDPAGPGVPPGQCPEGWRPVTPPLNFVLGCLPNNLVQPNGSGD